MMEDVTVPGCAKRVIREANPLADTEFKLS